MTRQRKVGNLDKQQQKSVKINLKERLENDDTSSLRTSIKIVACLICISIAAYVGYKGYLETRVNTPFDDSKMVVKSGLNVPERYWGTYRPGVYFGMKTREPYSPVFGIMWYLPRVLRATGGGIRHWCENGDNLNRFIWTEHDGTNFGIQEIEDGPFKITTSFVKRHASNHGGDWTARITVTNPDKTMSKEPIALLFYTAIEKHTKGTIMPKKRQGLIGVVGETDKLGPFSIRLMNVSGVVDHESYLSTEARGLNLLKETVLSSFTVVTIQGRKQIVLPGDLTKGNQPNFIISQVVVKTPFVMDVVYESDIVDRVNMLTGDIYANELKRRSDHFHNKFENVFGLKEKGFDNNKIAFAKAAFSNLIGGIGYFYGSSRVKSEYTKDPVPYWKAPLYTAVPSRSFFPRGFLWDEGFHGLIIAKWDLDIELDIISHWFDLMNVEGWIPREQILGPEALAKVPEQFVTQINTNANPPTFFVTLKFILDNFKDNIYEEKRFAALDRLYPRLTAWFNWFNTTQIGDLPGTYCWQGRDSKTNRELNPKTLTSGLDDYPRASHPNIDERHVDLRCWIALSAATIAEIAKILNRSSRKYEETFDYLSDQSLLDYLHWSPRTERYSDYGLHTDKVKLERPPPPPPPAPPVQQDMIRYVFQDPELQFVDTTFGYVSLFPFFFQLIDSNSPKLEKILNDIKNPELCWTNYGLRSLGTKSPLYMKYNTEHDGPYWRGPIWINMNFMAVKALLHYSKVPGPYSIMSAEIYDKLKTILINNIYREYKRTGYIWEQYNDRTGEGQGTKSFTGWSSLVVLLMADHL